MVEKANAILAEFNIRFRFACYDLETFTPSIIVKDLKHPLTWGLTCKAVNNKVIFFWKEYPELPRAETFEQYLENASKIKHYNEVITQLNNLELEVPIKEDKR